MRDDSQIIERFLAGDGDAVKQIHQWVEQVVHSRYWGLREHWADIAQDVLRKLIENFRRPGFRLRRPLCVYVYRVAQLTCIDYLRQQYHRPELENLSEDLHPIDERFEPDRWVQEIDERRLFFRLFHLLPDECRRLWQGFFLEGYSYREMGERWHLSEVNVRVKFHRCKQHALKLYRRLTRAPTP